MPTHQATRYTQFITPLGGIIALACFFMPWVRVDHTALSFSNTQSGFQFFVPNLGLHAPFIAAVFIASVVIVGLSLYMVIRRTPWKSRSPILISSGIGLAILLAEQLRYTRMTQVGDHSVYSIKLGFWGTIAGLVIAIIGVLLVKAEAEKGHPKVSVEAKQLWFVVHAGGIVALFCFFMPWEGNLALWGWPGFQLTKREPVVIIAFIASIITLIGSFYTLASGDFRRLRSVVLVSIGIGLGILFSYCVDFYIREIYMQNLLGSTGNEMTAYSLKIGFWGTVIGYIVAAVGMFLTRGQNRGTQVEISAESG